MNLGQRIKAARLEKGLSQRQLCGDRITRNMLSQIENGSARPSMETLRYFAGRLGKSVSFFLEEDTVTSPNQQCMVHARSAYARGDYKDALAALEDFRTPDESFQQEYMLLRYKALLALAEMAAAEGRWPYVLRLLEQANALQGIYIGKELRDRAAILTVSAGAAAQLPNVDTVLFLRAGKALEDGQTTLAAALLDSMEQQDLSWRLLRGKAYILQKEFARAREVLEQVQEEKAWPLLEICCKELGDFQGAYAYACKQRGN